MDIEQLTNGLNRNQITIICSEHLAPKTMVVSPDIWESFQSHNNVTVEATDEESVKNMLEHP